jgi:sarcosine oxidase subunit alpha
MRDPGPPLLSADARVEKIELSFEGQPVRAYAGEPLASALWREGEHILGRGVKYHRPRAAFCLQGSCGACLVRIDGKPNLRACMTPVAAGMRVERQNAYPSATLDLFGATDFFFPRGMDHQTLMTSAPKPVHAVMQKIARQLAGLGRLPDEPMAALPDAKALLLDVCVVGAGPAGLTAATAAARAGHRVVVVDEQITPGGSLLCDPRHGPADARARVQEARAAGAEIWSASTAIAYYAEDRIIEESEPGLLAIVTPGGLRLVRATHTVYATGSYDQNALFPDNDRPGIISARALGRLLVRDGVTPPKKAAVLGAGPYARALADALEKAGATVTRIDGVEETVAGVDGHSRLRAVRVRSGGRVRKVSCDVLAVAALPAPATELAREHGATVRWDAARGGFHVVADDEGRTSISGVRAVGDVVGFRGPQAAMEAGARVGASLERA